MMMMMSKLRIERLLDGIRQAGCNSTANDKEDWDEEDHEELKDSGVYTRCYITENAEARHACAPDLKQILCLTKGYTSTLPTVGIFPGSRCTVRPASA